MTHDEEAHQILTDSELTADDLREVVRSPRINERYHVGPVSFSRWRLMQIVALVFAGISIVGFWTIRQEREARDEQRCEVINDGRAGVRNLVERLITRSQPESPEEAAASVELRRITLEELPPVTYKDGECLPVSIPATGG